jgi:hypothetical protein
VLQHRKTPAFLCAAQSSTIKAPGFPAGIGMLAPFKMAHNPRPSLFRKSIMHHAYRTLVRVAGICCLPWFAHAAPAASATLPVNLAQEKLLTATEQERQAILTAYLARDKVTCTGVSKTFYQGSDHKGNVFWNLACSEGTTYVIQIFNNEINSTRSYDCVRLKEDTGGTCFTKFKQ